MLVLSSLLALAIPAALAQDDQRDLTTLTGTWSSGAQAVLTGPVDIIIDLTRKFVFLITVCNCFAGLCKSRKLVIHASIGNAQIIRGW